jgi:hypothetical protein
MTHLWHKIGDKPPFVHPDDLPFVLAHNSQLDDLKDLLWINTDRMAEPRHGDIDAPIVLLQLNPSYDERPLDIAQLRSDLLDEHAPHGGLRDPDNRWWQKRAFGKLRRIYDRERLMRRVCSIEYFPYASLQFGHSHLRLPTQQYQFDLVRRALSRQATLIVTRGFKLWAGAVPELADALGHTVFVTKSNQNPSISEGNLDPLAYQRIIAALDRA